MCVSAIVVAKFADAYFPAECIVHNSVCLADECASNDVLIDFN